MLYALRALSQGVRGEDGQTWCLVYRPGYSTAHPRTPIHDARVPLDTLWACGNSVSTSDRLPRSVNGICTPI